MDKNTAQRRLSLHHSELNRLHSLPKIDDIQWRLIEAKMWKRWDAIDRLEKFLSGKKKKK